jgi:hypothetical protein
VSSGGWNGGSGVYRIGMIGAMGRGTVAILVRTRATGAGFGRDMVGAGVNDDRSTAFRGYYRPNPTRAPSGSLEVSTWINKEIQDWSGPGGRWMGRRIAIGAGKGRNRTRWGGAAENE